MIGAERRRQREEYTEIGLLTRFVFINKSTIIIALLVYKIESRMEASLLYLNIFF